ncbi:bacterio-opsin activator [Thermocrinis jamiesonii]|uniref:bacterio-opsin activator n=1 Tax=Thermocrinis jamiesonii TaxID=1302351 RepID=UPI0004961910|nr:bacterio-opsin activator [Thermocrinis jamiesonii]
MNINFKLLDEDVETLVLRVFLKSIDLLGGLQNFVEHRRINWLPSLLLACYSVVLKEEYMKTEQEIAQRLKITPQTVKNILRADPSVEIVKTEKEGKDISVHTAGSIAKIAYRLVKYGLDDVRISLEFSKSTVKALDITWAYVILKKLKWNDFPIASPQDIKERLKKIYIKGRLAEEILEDLDYPINTPVELIKLIKENLKMYGLE